MKTSETAKNQLKAILSELIDAGLGFSANNNVFESEAFGDSKLWYWFGQLRVVRPGQNVAGEMEVLSDWNTEADGSITLIGKKEAN